jgi:hypothetical protein
MTAFEIFISTTELGKRCSERLRGGAASTDVVWQNGSRRLLIHTGSVAVRSVEGWLLVNLDVESDQTKRCTLQFVFYMGKRDEGNGVAAAATINAATASATQLADGWGNDLQRVLWDGVLDGVEACVASVAAQSGSQALMLQGFFSDSKSMIVSVLAGV